MGKLTERANVPHELGCAYIRHGSFNCTCGAGITVMSAAEIKRREKMLARQAHRRRARTQNITDTLKDG
jgi:hypothetical protein